MKSILQKNKDYCYLCSILNGDNSYKPDTEEHHIFPGNPNRKLSERYGLKVYLCIRHHRTGPDAVHKEPNRGNDLLLKQIGQQAFEKRYPFKDFRQVFGKNYKA